jgi:hypothetical protein
MHSKIHAVDEQIRNLVSLRVELNRLSKDWDKRWRRTKQDSRISLEKSGHQKCVSAHQAHAYASTRGSAPALNTPVFASMMMAALDARDQGGATCNL